MTTVSTHQPLPQEAVPGLLWLDLTRRCQLECVHCYNASGPQGDHGTMTRADWLTVLDQAADTGVRHVQLIGGEPTLHPDFAALLEHALGLGLNVEVYTNLVHVPQPRWDLFQRAGVSLATSYYSTAPEQHNAMTGRPSHARTRANIERALRFGIPLRVGIVSRSDEQAAAARSELAALGVPRISVDRVREFGRASAGCEPDPGNLCGRCGDGRAAVGPDGTVSPCVFSTWIDAGNVRDAPLAAILGGPVLSVATTAIRRAARAGQCDPACEPNAECQPGFPSAECDPRR